MGCAALQTMMMEEEEDDDDVMLPVLLLLNVSWWTMLMMMMMDGLNAEHRVMAARRWTYEPRWASRCDRGTQV